MEALKGTVRKAYDRGIGLELAKVAVIPHPVG